MSLLIKLCHGSIIITALITNDKVFAHRMLIIPKSHHDQPMYPQQSHIRKALSSSPKPNVSFHWFDRAFFVLSDFKETLSNIVHTIINKVHQIKEQIFSKSNTANDEQSTIEKTCCQYACLEDYGSQSQYTPLIQDGICKCNTLSLIWNGNGKDIYPNCVSASHQQISIENTCCKKACLDDYSDHRAQITPLIDSGRICQCGQTINQQSTILPLSWNGNGKHIFPTCVKESQIDNTCCKKACIAEYSSQYTPLVMIESADNICKCKKTIDDKSITKALTFNYGKPIFSKCVSELTLKESEFTFKESCCNEACQEDYHSSKSHIDYSEDKCKCTTSTNTNLPLISNGNGKNTYWNCITQDLVEPKTVKEMCCRAACKRDYDKVHPGLNKSKMKGEECRCYVQSIGHDVALQDNKSSFLQCVNAAAESREEAREYQKDWVERRGTGIRRDPNEWKCYCGSRAACELLSSPLGAPLNPLGTKFDCKLPFEIAGKKGWSDLTGEEMVYAGNGDIGNVMRTFQMHDNLVDNGGKRAWVR